MNRLGTVVAELPVLTALVLTALVLTGSTAVWSQDLKQSPETPPKRLLEAELLEVSKGDLDAAIKIYEALLADASTDEKTRARALLYRARCQRKRGQLDEATRSLEKIVEDYTKQTDVLRQAQGYLEEIRNGRSANPSFDWFQDFQQSAEIQALVFDLAMGLVGSDEDKKVARNKLLALGTVAVPVLERLLETSRNESHRHELAWILLRSDRFEHLRTIMQRPPTLSDRRFRKFLDRIQELSKPAQERIKDLLLALPASSVAHFQASRAFMLLPLTGFSGVTEHLLTIERFYHTKHPGGFGYLVKFVNTSPAFAEAVLNRMLAPDCPTDLTFSYRELLEEGAPDRIRGEHLIAFHKRRVDELLPLPENRSASLGDHIRFLAELGAWDVLENIAGPRTRRSLYRQFERSTKDGYESTPAEWGRILRRCGTGNDFLKLWEFGHKRDEAVGELAGWLASESPPFGGWFELAHLADWAPSEKFANVFVPLLDSDQELARAIALETLTLGGADYDAVVIAAAEKILQSATEPHPLSEFALAALLRIFVRDPSVGPIAARLYKAEFLKRAPFEVMPASYGESELARAEAIGSFRRDVSLKQRRHRKPERLEYRRSVNWPLATIRNAAPEVHTELHKHVLDLVDDEGGFHFFGWFFGEARNWDWNVVWARASTIQNVDFRKWLIVRKELMQEFKAGNEQVVAFATACVRDGKLPKDHRDRAYEAFDRHRRKDILFDWPAHLESKDRLRVHFFSRDMFRGIRRRDAETRQAVHAAALASPDPAVRINMAYYYKEEDDPHLEKTQPLDRDPNYDIRYSMLKRLIELQNAHVASRMLGYLGDDSPEIVMMALDAAVPMAAPESLEKIGQLTEHPNLKVRSKAFETLDAIREKLKAKKEWETLIQSRRQPKEVYEQLKRMQKILQERQLPTSESTENAPSKKPEKAEEAQQPDEPEPPQEPEKQEPEKTEEP